MRSYWDHLKTQENKKEEVTKQHPHFRSSALFPVVQNPGVSTRLIFLGYWLLKRKIAEIGNVITLRSQEGLVLLRSFQEISLPKCYRVELSDLLNSAQIPLDKDFIGSIEIEFFSGKPLVFPFPAVSINYYGDTFSSVVHAAERVYNDFEDMQRNQKKKVAESGFDLHANMSSEPFFALVNGPEKVVDDTLEVTFINYKNEILLSKSPLKLEPYETRFYYLNEMMDLKAFLEGKTGTAKIQITLPWVFPRMLAANRDSSSNAIVLTHTYYDSSACDTPQDFWIKEGENWFSAALMLPIFIDPEIENSISFYPIYSPSSFTIDAEVYNAEGKRVAFQENFFIRSKEQNTFERVSLDNLLKKCPQGFASLRIIAKETTVDPIPSRIKVAINIGRSAHLPCNICTNLQPYYPEWETKKRSFRWLPLLFDQKGAKTIIMNSSPLKNYQETAHLRLVFYREQDDTTLIQEKELAAHGFIVLDEIDSGLSEFLQGKIGWVTIESQNPYLTTYYFVFHPSGIVGGDHGY